jgi:ankyrin repeat protein
VDARDRFANTALHHAAQGGHAGMIALLLDRGAKIDQPNLAGSTPLLQAVTANKRKAVQALLAGGASIDIVGANGVTPLGAAAFNGNDDIVELLLQSGARPEDPDRTGKGAIVYAAAKGFTSIVTLLLDAGLDPGIGYAHALTALMWAAGHGNDVPPPDGLETVRLLVSRGAGLDAVDDRGRDALMIAAERDHPLVVQYLLDMGADAGARDNSGKSAYDLAVSDAVRELFAP